MILKIHEKAINNFKNEIKGFIDSALDTINSLMDSIKGVIDGLAKTFGIDSKGLCDSGMSNLLAEIEDQFMEFLKDAENNFVYKE